MSCRAAHIPTLNFQRGINSIGLVTNNCEVNQKLFEISMQESSQNHPSKTHQRSGRYEYDCGSLASFLALTYLAERFAWCRRTMPSRSVEKKLSRSDHHDFKTSGTHVFSPFLLVPQCDVIGVRGKRAAVLRFSQERAAFNLLASLN